MGNNGPRCTPTQDRIRQKRGGDEQTIGDVVKTVAKQNGQRPFIIMGRMMMAVRMIVAVLGSRVMVVLIGIVVDVTPQRKFFEHEETQDAAQQD